MRIALIAHSTAHWTPLYAAYFASRGHTVRVFSYSREPLPGFDVAIVGRGTPKRFKLAGYLAHVPRVRRALRRFAPDVVLATYLSSNGMVAALAHPRSLVVSAHGGDVLRQAGYLPGGSLHARMMRFVCARAGVVHAVSREIVETLADCGVPRDRMHCFPVGIDVDWFTPADTPRPPGPPRIICTRRQEAVYGNDSLVSALAVLRDEGVDFAATLVGGGPLLEERRAQVDELGLRDTVHLTGQVSPSDLRDALRHNDVYVSASSSDGTSLSLLEAMASGPYPVVSSIPANTEWIEDGATGLLFDAGDTAGLADALRRALACDGDERADVAARNRQRVERDGNLSVNMERMERLLVQAAS